MEHRHIEVPHPKKKFWKFWIVFGLCNLGFLFILFKLLTIQVIDNDKYKNIARKQHESRIKVNAERGDVLDRNGLLLATTYQSISIAVDPTILKTKEDREKIAEQLAGPIGMTKKEILKKIRSAKGSFGWIVRGLKPERLPELDKIEHKGLIKLSEPKRKYPYGKLSGQIIGCTDIDNTGIEGIEKYWDEDLHGQSGYKIMFRDATGRLLPAANQTLNPLVKGSSLVLTIDSYLQRVMEYELEEGVIRTEAKSATAIAINPKTGEILAMASYPNYNPNNPGRNTISSGAMKNRAVTDQYEPGSTFKLITASAALEEGMITPDDTVDGKWGVLRCAGYTIRDDHPMRKVPFREALVHSSNVIFAEIGNQLPAKKFYKYARDFGFGISHDIELPGEVSGSLKKPKELKTVYKRYMGHGYALSSTALQILVAYGTIANDGVMMKPYIVKEVLDSKGNVIRQYEPERVRKVVSQKTADTLTNILVEVVKRGTARRVAIEGLNIAGKTGTSKISEGGGYTDDYYGSFAGFFPAEDPQVAMLVVVEKPSGVYYGGATAGPIFKNIALRWLNLNPLIGASIPDYVLSAHSDSAYVPDITGLYIEDAGKICDNYHFTLQNNSSKTGIVSVQSPAPGELAKLNSLIHVVVDKFLTADSLKIDSLHYLPDIIGFSSRRAMNILHNQGYRTRIFGSGRVSRQKIYDKDSNGVIVGLYCE